MVDGQHNIFAPLHGDTGNLRVMPAGTVNTQTHHQQLFNPYPDAYDPDCPESCFSYFLSIAEDPRWVNGVMLFPAMAACEFMRDHSDDFFFESKLQQLHSHEIITFERSLLVTDSANAIHHKLEHQLLPQDTTTQVLEYFLDGSNADECATSALEVLDGLAEIFDQRSSDRQIKGGDLRIGGKVHLSILRYLSPENDDLEEYHVIDPRLSLYYNCKQLTTRAKRTVVVGSDSLVRLLYRIFLTEFGSSNGHRTITDFNIHVRVHSRLLTEENIRYGLGADFNESLEEMVGTPINDIIQRNYELHGYMAATDPEITPESVSIEPMAIVPDEDDDTSIDSSPPSDGDDPPAGHPGEGPMDADETVVQPTDDIPLAGHNSVDDLDELSSNEDLDAEESDGESDESGDDDVDESGDDDEDESRDDDSDESSDDDAVDDCVMVNVPNQVEDGVMVDVAIQEVTDILMEVTEEQDDQSESEEEDDQDELEVEEDDQDGIAELPPADIGDCEVIDLATEESWERHDNIWYPEWDLLMDAEAQRIGLLPPDGNLQPDNAAVTDEGPNVDHQCLVCLDDENPAVAASDRCGHRLCIGCALNLVTVAPFVQALRDHRHNMYRTGRCPFCRIPGVWTDANGQRIGPRNSPPIIGYIEQNDTSRQVQLYQWKICEERLWQSLVISTGSGSRRPWMLLPGLDISRSEREETCRTFFLSVHGRQYFTCTICKKRFLKRFRVRLNICEEDCKNYLMCMRCAIDRQNEDFDKEERRHGRNPALRRFRDQIVIRYPCGPCKGRGRLVREDGKQLLCLEGWSRPEVDEILQERQPPPNLPNIL
jgi:hypothetical protein